MKHPIIDIRPKSAWSEGGTFITNFDKEERELYQKAIEKHESITRFKLLQICDEAYDATGLRMKSMYSLNYCNLIVANHSYSLDRFWRIYEELKEELKNQHNERE